MTNTDHGSELLIADSDRAALGAFQSFHAAASRIHKVNIAIAAVFTALLLGPAVWFVIAALREPGKGMWIGAGLFGALGLLPAVGLVYLIRKLRWRLYLFAHGFVFVRGAARVVLWDDIQSFYERQDVVGGIQADRWLRFLLADGRRLTIDSSYKDFPTFARAVRESVTRTVLRRASETLSRGQAVAFGKLNLSQAGLEKPGASLPWADVHSIAIEPRVSGQVHAHGVVVYKRGPQAGGAKEKVEWYMKLIPDFGNVEAFLRLAGQFMRGGRLDVNP